MAANPSNGSSSSPGSIRLCTEKLNETNFSAWRYNMHNALAYHGFDGYIKEHTPALMNHPEYQEQLVQVTTFIWLHLGRKDSTRFVENVVV
jgi:hypothetical protein